MWQRWFAQPLHAHAACVNSGRAGGLWGGEGRVCWEWHGEKRTRRVWEQQLAERSFRSIGCCRCEQGIASSYCKQASC